MESKKMLEQEKAEAMATLASKATYSGAATAMFFGLTAQEFGIVVGAIVGIAGLLVNWYYKHKAFQLKKLVLTKMQQNIIDDED